MTTTYPPPYEPPSRRPSLDNPFSSLHRLSTSSSASPPPYSAAPFSPTVQFQIETPGKPWLSLPLPPRPDPIPIYALPLDAESASPSYLSLRPSRCSGSCHLTSPLSITPLSTTTYRFGPGRPPVVRLYLPGAGPDTPASDSRAASPGCSGDDDPDQVDLDVWNAFPLLTPTLSRTTTFTTRLGTFAWRYGSRAERKAVPCDSLLILDKITKVSGARNLRVEDGEARTTIARLIRSDGTRSAGSGKGSAGNGGLLELDLGPVGDAKHEREMMTVLVVTTALVMLKKEVDRRRAVQIALMVGGGGGGP